MAADRLSHADAAKLVGVSRPAISAAVKSGKLVEGQDGKLSPAHVRSWNAGRRTPRGGRPPKNPPFPKNDAPSTKAPGVSADEELETAAARLVSGGLFPDRAAAELHRDSFTARLAELKYQRARGEVIEIHLVADTVGQQFAQVRTRLLAIPSEAAPRLASLQTAAEVQDELLRQITEALEALSYDDPAFKS